MSRGVRQRGAGHPAVLTPALVTAAVLAGHLLGRGLVGERDLHLRQRGVYNGH